MITDLPNTLTVDGVQREINADFRDVINILCAYNDTELNSESRTYILLNNLYVDDYTQFSNIDEAIEQAVWFIDCGNKYSKTENNLKLMDWEQDYNIIISAVNKCMNVLDVRELPFLHWWTFLGYLSERGECRFSTIVEIRDKLNKGTKLENWEKQMLRENREQIVLTNSENDEFEKEMWGD